MDAPMLVSMALIWGFTIATVEAVALIIRAQGPGQPEVPIGATPADGVVGVAMFRSVRVEKNDHDPRFGRIVVIEAEPGDRSAPPRRCRPTLLGRVVVVPLFVERDGDRGRWTQAEIAQTLALLIRSGVWIEREAIRYRAPVNLEVADGYIVAADETPRPQQAIDFDVEGDRVRPVEVNESVELVASCSRAVARLDLGAGVADLASLLDRLERRIDADRIAWLILPRSAGQSQAIQESISGIPAGRLAICYAREAEFVGALSGPAFVDPVSVVHELLHLFGASDKYGIPLDAFPHASVTRWDVMRLDDERLSRLRIDPLTAREVGWPAEAAGERPTPAGSVRGTKRASG
jgi:hypothetical protein